MLNINIFNLIKINIGHYKKFLTAMSVYVNNSKIGYVHKSNFLSSGVEGWEKKKNWT
jgi:hypothetical protein